MRIILTAVTFAFFTFSLWPPGERNMLFFQKEGLPDGWKDLLQMDSSLILDIKYASDENFTGEKLYDCARCLLRTEVAEALLAVNKEVEKRGLRLKVFDCYRPRHIQERMWQIIPDARYVAPPSQGSMHNRGLAVDLTLVDAASGEELDMGSAYDSFEKESHHSYKNLPQAVLLNREYLKTEMVRYGFTSIQSEWWHYSYQSLSSPLYDFNWSCPGSSKATLEGHGRQQNRLPSVTY